MSRKIKKQQLLFQQELQGTPEEALESAKAKLQDACQDATGYTSLCLSEACQCSHLAQWLPHKLDLNFCKPPPPQQQQQQQQHSSSSSSQPSLLLKHPIHALHLASQLEPDGTIVEKNVRQLGSSPWIYGEEQQRTVALSQAGIPDAFYPLTQAHVFHAFNPPNPDAPKPLHADTVVPTVASTTTAAATDTACCVGSGAAAVKTEEENKDPTATTTTTTTTTTAKDGSKPDDNKSQDSTKNPEEVSSSAPTVSFASPIVVPVPEQDDKKDSIVGDDKKDDSTLVPTETPFSSLKESNDTADTKTTEEAKEDSKTDNKTDDKPKDPASPKHEGEEVKDVEMKESEESKSQGDDTKEASTKMEDEEKKQVDEKPKEPNDGGENDNAEAKDVEMKDASASDEPKTSDETKTKAKESPSENQKKGEEAATDQKSSEAKETTDEVKDVDMKSSESQPLEETKKEDTTSEIKEESQSDKPIAKEDKDILKKDGSKEEDKAESKVEPKEEEEEASKGEGKSEEREKSKDSTSKEEVKDALQNSEDAKSEPNTKEVSDKDSESKKDGKEDNGEPKQEDKTHEETKSSAAAVVDTDNKSKTGGDNLDKKDEKVGNGAFKEDKADDGKEKASSEEKEGDMKKDVKAGVEEANKPDAITSASKATSVVSSSSAAPTAATVVSNANATASKPGTASSASTPAASTKTYIPATTPKYELSEPRYMEISRQEDQIKNIRSLLAKRVSTITPRKKTSKKRKSDPTSSSIANGLLQNLPGNLQYQNERAITEMTALEKEEWLETKNSACRKVELWLEMFRSSRRLYWQEEKMIQEVNTMKQKVSSSLSSWTASSAHLRRTCNLCKDPRATGDEIMQCLECTFVGCGPSSVCHQSRGQHMLQHMFLSGHRFAVSCGVRAEVFCFSCGDFVYHKVFDQEKERLDLAAKIPWLAWNDHALQRSFDPLQFVRLADYGIVWRGLMASYPPLVPQEHIDAARFCIQRQAVFEGHLVDTKWPLLGRQALDFAIHQSKQAPSERWRIPFPIGMYNLGNTCFMSSIIQCLIHCVPLQRYFLKEIGHNHKSCKTYRSLSIKAKTATTPLTSPATDDICLACEMDSLFLEYYRRSTGRDVVSILDDLAKEKPSAADTFAEISRMDEELCAKGEPMVIDKMLHVAWKSSGMNHLAGYDQRDAHEFMHAFLDILGKQICQHRARVDASIKMAQCGSPFSRQVEEVHHDVIKHLFEGTLRSVLVCEECGSKRMLSEAFLNVSLPLSKELMLSSIMSSQASSTLSLDRCLEHFTAPEKLADPVDCPACGRKTPTKKQHTISKLPRVLCIHLKRFHAALNKKIDDFVAFPATGLNMGPHLPHWREVTTVPDSKREPVKDGSTNVAPEVLYDLFGTVNHVGNLQSGHYITNIKVQDQWFSINDQRVSLGDEVSVLSNAGAYILFYTRRSF